MITENTTTKEDTKEIIEEIDNIKKTGNKKMVKNHMEREITKVIEMVTKIEMDNNQEMVNQEVVIEKIMTTETKIIIMNLDKKENKMYKIEKIADKIL
jgi:hypothetical protein